MKKEYNARFLRRTINGDFREEWEALDDHLAQDKAFLAHFSFVLMPNDGRGVTESHWNQRRHLMKASFLYSLFNKWTIPAG